MVSCKAGQGCGEMCVTGELMHVHADEQAIGMQYAWRVHSDAAATPAVTHTAFSEPASNRRRLPAAQEDGVEMPDLNLSITAVANPSKG